jgi:2Fe-2S ferredoxin
MAKVHVTDVDGNKVDIEVEASGQPLMEIMRDNDIEIEAICGGVCSCATCHIYVGGAWADKIPARSDDEFELVSSTEHYQENSRLSCQIDFKPELDGIEVTVAPEE